MKNIKYVEPISIPLSHCRACGAVDGNKNMSMREWIEIIVDGHVPFGTGLSNINKGLQVIEAFDHPSEEGIVNIEDTTFEMLKKAVDSFTGNPKVMRSCLPYYNAIEDAEKAKK